MTMSCSLGIIALKNDLLFLLGDQNGVFAFERRLLSPQIAERLSEIFSIWGLKRSAIGDVYVVFAPSFEKLLPPDWNHRHLRLTPSPVEKEPFLSEFLKTRVYCVNNIEKTLACSDEVVTECAGVDGVSIIAS